MDNVMIARELRAVIAELDKVRRSLMADEPRRITFEWANRAKRDAETLLACIESDETAFREAAE